MSAPIPLNVKGDLTRARKISGWTVSETGIHSVQITERFRVKSKDEEPLWWVVPPPPMTMALTKIRIDFSEDGYGDTTWSFEGLDMNFSFGFGAKDQPMREMKGNTTREPITSHPDIGAWLTSKHALRFDGGEVVWATKDPTGESTTTGLSKTGETVTGINPLYGVQDYLACGAEFVVTTAKKGKLPEDLFSDIGTVIRNPPDGPIVKDRNWLVAGVSATQHGDSYEIQKRWIMSGLGGWMEELYKPVPIKYT